MSDNDRPSGDGSEQTFKVRDRRQFTSEGERRESAPEPAAAKSDPTPPPPPPRPAEAPQVEPAGSSPSTAAEDPPRKRSLRERILGRKGREDESAPVPGAEPPDVSADEINFPNFILSLMTQALMHMGEIPDPITQQAHRDLGLAKQTIDLIGLLEQKTKGNLNKDEEHLMSEVLYRLRLQFVEVAKRA